MTTPIDPVINEEPISYKEVFDEIIEHLSEVQLNGLIEEIETQKTLLKVKECRRTKMRQELKKEKAELLKKMKDQMKKSAKNDEESDEEETEIRPKKKKVVKK